MLKTSMNRCCPICVTQEGIVLHHQQFLNFDKSTLASEYHVVCCTNCGFVYADVDTDQGIFDKYYELNSKYEDKETSTGGGLTEWDKQRLTETAKYISSLNVTQAAKIVDLGCGNGGLLKALSDFGYNNLFGVDPSPICARNVNNGAGIVGLQGSLDKLPPEIKGCEFINPFACT